MEVLARGLVKVISWVLVAAVFVALALAVFAPPTRAQVAIVIVVHLLQRRSCDDGRQG